MGLFATVLSVLPSWALTGGGNLEKNTGDRIVARLQVGMTVEKVRAVIADFKDLVTEGAPDPVKTEEEIFRLYTKEYYPRDFLKTVRVGTSFMRYSYWITAHASMYLDLFFDESKQLRGWVNEPSEYSRDKFMHERLTSKLRSSLGGIRKGMMRAQVHALIGPPAEVIAPPKEKSRTLYEDHFFVSPPIFDLKKQQLEVYSYMLQNGAKRRVYLFYYPAADELLSWGYDHAREEAERYLREQAAQKK